MIGQRFGLRGLRLFRILYLHPQLEQKQIGEMSMLDQKVHDTTLSCHCCLMLQ